MTKMEKNEKFNDELSKDIELFSDFLSFEYYDWRIKSLADKIKSKNYKPNTRIYNF